MIHIGHSYDIHRFKDEGNYIILGGIKIATTDCSIIAHSDGDVLFHALSEAILTSIGLEDIGQYFPDNSKNTLNMDSRIILDFSLEELKKHNYHLNNVVVHIELDRFKLKEYKKIIKENLCKILSLNSDSVSVVAGTNEGLDSIGQNKAIKVTATVLVESDKEI